jgi:uncharacterized protein (TIGR02145 family)
MITVQNISFTCGAELTDPRDGKKYRTGNLSGKCWMRENLQYGTSLTIDGSPQTDNCLPEKRCNPADPGCSQFGGFYQWNEIMNYSELPASQGLCPPSWHIPTDAEWQSLIDNLVSGISAPVANALAGGTLKDPQVFGGFNALFSGMEYLNYYWGFMNESYKGTLYWTSTLSGSARAVARGLNFITPSVSRYYSSTGNAFPVRCIKD